MSSYDILIDPQRLMRVKFLDPARVEQNMVALTCGYVPARGSDARVRVAVEIVVDPAEQNPAVPYYCDPQRLQRYLVAPGDLRGIMPYSIA